MMDECMRFALIVDLNIPTYIISICLLAWRL